MDAMDRIKELASGSKRRGPKAKTDLTISRSVTTVVDTLSNEQKIASLKKELDESKKAVAPIMLKMPVSGQSIGFRSAEVDPDLIDVSPFNRRQQSLLTLASVSDIFHSIQATQQNKPGLLREKEDGRFELVGGSRRLFCVKHIPGRLYKGLIGPIPDEDMKALEKEDNEGLAISEYEIGLHYLNMLPHFENETQFFKDYAHIEGESPATIRRRTNLAKLPRWVVELFATPNDIPKTKIEWLVKALKDKKQASLLEMKGESIAKENASLFQSEGKTLDAESILKQLKLSITPTSLKTRKNAKPIVLQNLRGNSVGSYKINSQGQHIFQIDKLSQDKIDKLHAFMTDLLS